MTVGEFCNRQVVIARRHERLGEAARRMRDFHVGTLVGEVMTADPVTARDGDNLWDVFKKMRSFGVRRLPVVHDQGSLEGILSFDDLIDLVAEELSDLNTLVSREQERERETKSTL